MPFRDLLTIRTVASPAAPTAVTSQVRWTRSYATTGSLTKSSVPGGEEKTVRRGSRPVVHVAPASREVAKPIPAAPPLT